MGATTAGVSSSNSTTLSWSAVSQVIATNMHAFGIFGKRNRTAEASAAENAVKYPWKSRPLISTALSQPDAGGRLSCSVPKVALQLDLGVSGGATACAFHDAQQHVAESTRLLVRASPARRTWSSDADRQSPAHTASGTRSASSHVFGVALDGGS